MCAGVSGRTGRSNEPFNTVDNSLLHQSILRAAYRAPASVRAIADELCMAGAFAEDSVDVLSAAQLMGRMKNGAAYTVFP